MLPEKLSEIIKTNIFIVEKWKIFTILIYLNVVWQIQPKLYKTFTNIIFILMRAFTTTFTSLPETLST